MIFKNYSTLLLEKLNKFIHLFSLTFWLHVGLCPISLYCCHLHLLALLGDFCSSFSKYQFCRFCVRWSWSRFTYRFSAARSNRPNSSCLCLLSWLLLRATRLSCSRDFSTFALSRWLLQFYALWFFWILSGWRGLLLEPALWFVRFVLVLLF